MVPALNAIEPEVAEFQRIDEHIDRSNRITLVDPIIKAFRQQRRLLAIRPLNETFNIPSRFSKGIIASIGFLHGLDPKRSFTGSLVTDHFHLVARCKSDRLNDSR
jgi:hypothetical protein